MIESWYEADKSEIHLRLRVSDFLMVKNERLPSSGSFCPTGGISLDYVQDLGWQESIDLHPESLSMALMRFAWIAACEEHRKRALA